MNPFPGYLVANLTVAANMRVQQDRSGFDARIEILRRRLEALGGKFAGQDCGEGIIDSEGTWHDFGTSALVDEDLLIGAEKIIVELERKKAERERYEKRDSRGLWFKYDGDDE